ncbi:MAG: hypothetical protein KAR03_04195 [Candidatus Thorarchaeota archaeon]|nr:hypothetical protein [Candidatus Thorarchaeota archaeon]
MNTLIIVIAVVAVAGATYFYLKNNKPAETKEEAPQAPQEPQQAAPVAEEAAPAEETAPEETEEKKEEIFPTQFHPSKICNPSSYVDSIYDRYR